MGRPKNITPIPKTDPTPTPSPTVYNADSARTGGTSKTNYGSGTRLAPWGRTKYNPSKNPDDLYFVPNPNGTVFNGAINSGWGTGVFAEKGNKSRFILNAYGETDTLETLVNDYLKGLSKDNRIMEVKNLLIAKNYYGDTASATASLAEGKVADQAFVDALYRAAAKVSFTNVSLYNAGETAFLSIDDGLKALQPATSTTSDGGSGSGGRYVTLNYENFNAEDYRIAVDDAYKQVTGQAADDATLNQFMETMNALAKKNPIKTVTTVKGKTTTTKTTGGVSDQLQSELRKQMLEDPETESYQKATNFMDMFINAIKGPGEL